MERRAAFAAVCLLLGTAGVLTPLVAVDFGASGYGAWYTGDSRAPVLDPAETVRYEFLTSDARIALSVPYERTDMVPSPVPDSPPVYPTNFDARLSAAEWEHAEYLRANEYVRVRTDEWTRTYAYETAYLPFEFRRGHDPGGLVARMGFGAVALALGAGSTRRGRVPDRGLRGAVRIATGWVVGVTVAVAIASQANPGALPPFGPLAAYSALFVAGAGGDKHVRLQGLAVAAALAVSLSAYADPPSTLYAVFATLAFAAGVVFVRRARDEPTGAGVAE